MAIRLTRKKVLIAVAVVLVIAAGAAAAYFLLPNRSADITDENNTNNSSTKKPYQKALEDTQQKVDTLVENGDDESIKEAQQLADEQVAAAEQSGDEDYSFYAQLAKANLLIDLDRPQEAIDILLPLAEKYGGTDPYKSQVYTRLALAYSRLGNDAKADEYLNMVSGIGGE
jgi:predicted Zn-dependent protease